MRDAAWAVDACTDDAAGAYEWFFDALEGSTAMSRQLMIPTAFELTSATTAKAGVQVCRYRP